MRSTQWVGTLKGQNSQNIFDANLALENENIYGIGLTKTNQNLLITGKRNGKKDVEIQLTNMQDQKVTKCTGSLNFQEKNGMSITGTYSEQGGSGTFEMRKLGGGLEDNAGELIPPNYTINARNTVRVNTLDQNSTKNLFKNPRWQEICNFGPDIGSNNAMVKIDRQKLFEPDIEDVYEIEHEVTYYRHQRERKEQDLQRLEAQKRAYQDEIKQEKELEGIEDFLDELDQRNRLKEQETQELMRKKQELEKKKMEISQKLNQTLIGNQSAMFKSNQQAEVKVQAPIKMELPKQVLSQPVQSTVPTGFTRNTGPVNILDGPMSGGLSRLPTRVAESNYMEGGYSRNQQPTQPTYQQQGSSTAQYQGANLRFHGSAQNITYPQGQMNPSLATGTTYRINGQVYTKETLPPQYAHYA